jgi:hypothetical protein
MLRCLDETSAGWVTTGSLRLTEGAAASEPGSISRGRGATVSSRGAEGSPFGVAGRASVDALVRPLQLSMLAREQSRTRGGSQGLARASSPRGRLTHGALRNPLALLGCSLD